MLGLASVTTLRRVEALVVGLGLGLAAGISPGPLLFLVIGSALRGGWPAGVLAASAPLVTDALVIAGTLLVLDRLPDQALGYVALAGAAFVAWTGVQTIREAPQSRLVPAGAVGRHVARQALARAGLVNLLSPHPWVFWGTVLGPMVVTTWADQRIGAIALVAGFYVTIVGSKAVIAVLVARGRERIGETGYRRALSAAGVLLVLAAVFLVVEFLPMVR